MNKPNILLLMVDQMTASAMSIYGNSVCRMPNMDRLAARSLVFDNAYTNSPLCAPARFALLSGRESSRINAFDNASEFQASQPTIAHHLRQQGYWTSLCGKMHFIGPDQLHGYNERITTDVYPASFAWVPHWDKGAGYITSGVTCGSVIEAAACIRSMQMDYDDEVEYRGIQRLYDLARNPALAPFFMTISFTHPHHPFTISEEYWDRYRHDDIDMPRVGEIPFEQLDYHSQGLYFAHGRHLHDITEAHVRNARHAYYGMLSYVDDKIGRILDTLEETGLAQDTLVVFTSDHGEMLGERGMWHKHHFFESALRTPLCFSLPGEIKSGRVDSVVSHIDILPTLMEFLGADEVTTDGTSFMAALQGKPLATDRAVFADYLAIGPCVPCRMVRRGDFKYLYTHGKEAQLFNISQDPDELANLADDAGHRQLADEMCAIVLQDWDPQEIDARVRRSQRHRIAINRAGGAHPSWDFVFRKGDEGRFVRNREVDGTKGKYRLPRIQTLPPNRPELTAEQIERAMHSGSLV